MRKHYNEIPAAMIERRARLEANETRATNAIKKFHDSVDKWIRENHNVGAGTILVRIREGYTRRYVRVEEVGVYPDGRLWYRVSASTKDGARRGLFPGCNRITTSDIEYKIHRLAAQ